MSNLSIWELYQNQDENLLTRFMNNTKSSIKINTDFEQVELDTEWIDIIEEVIPHLDAILRNPNRFIINEEEIVKIEKAKRVTVESIKDLAKHTNFIQAIDDEGVKPSKILNINKEETFDTYENRLIYTLIQNTRNYVDLRKASLLQKLDIQAKDEKKIQYNGRSTIGKENIGISFEIKSQKSGSSNSNNKDLLDRIAKIYLDLTALQNTEVYKALVKMHAAVVRSPIKKTNMILKNVHFQYAMKLWDYESEHMEDKTKQTKDKDESEDNEEIKRYGNDTFLLNYLALNTLSRIKDDENSKDDEKTRDFFTNQLIEQIIIINPDLTAEQLESKITGRVAKIRTQHTATIAEVRRIFKTHFDKYINKVER